MHQIVQPLKPDPASLPPVSRRALLEGSASAALVAAAVGSSGAVLRPGAANAVDPAPAGRSARQMAAFRIREAAAQAYLDEQQPVHRSNADEAR